MAILGIFATRRKTMNAQIILLSIESKLVNKISSYATNFVDKIEEDPSLRSGCPAQAGFTNLPIRQIPFSNEIWASRTE